MTLVHSTTKKLVLRVLAHPPLSHTSCRYLVSNDLVHIPQVERDLSVRCLVYLGMVEFDAEKSENEIEEAYLRGVYAFADYAACFWALHTESALSHSDNQATDSVELISECLESFLEMHWVSEGKLEEISDKLQKSLAMLQQHEFYERACQAVAAAKSWLRPTSKAPSDENALHLPQAIRRIRSVLERLTSSSLSKITEDFIVQHYGSNCFKCPRMNCQFFYQGFVNNDQRDLHTAKHDRCFTCIWQGCLYETIGFTTSKDLRTHIFQQHGVNDEPDDLKFPESGPSTLKRNQKHPALFACDLCPRTFTRPFNLKNHLRTHRNERPFACALCDKAFSRNSDLRRHEDSHTDEKRFVCGGELKSQPGRSWGCGRRFARADALALHVRSEAGQACIEPFLAQETAQKLNEMSQNPTDQQKLLQDLSRQNRKDLLDLPGGLFTRFLDSTRRDPVEGSASPRHDDMPSEEFTLPAISSQSQQDSANQTRHVSPDLLADQSTEA